MRGARQRALYVVRSRHGADKEGRRELQAQAAADATTSPRLRGTVPEALAAERRMLDVYGLY